MTLLHTTARQLARLQAQCEEDPIKWFSPTIAQKRFLEDPGLGEGAKVKLLRGANQCGKTVIGAYESLSRLLGRHPYLKTPPPPVIGWVLCHSWEQSKAIQQKIYDMTPKKELHPDMEYITGKGFRGTGAPVIRFRNGSILRVKTTQQSGGGRGTLGLASESIDFVHIDEPCPAHIFSEVYARVIRRRGTIFITMTPTLPVEYLKTMVEEGRCSETIAPLTLENVTPLGTGRPLLTAQEIESISSNYMAYDRAVRLSGAWYMMPDGQIFDGFKEDMISKSPCPPGIDYKFAIGIDHGSDATSQAFILIAYDETNDFVYVLDEYVAGSATAETHAKHLIRMLQRNSLQPNQITSWIGDRAYGGNKYGGKMSNKMLMSALCHVLNYPPGRLPFYIKTAFKPRWSVFYGTKCIHERMVLDHFIIHPRCKRTIMSIKNWSVKKTGQLSRNCEWSHCIDALRYALMPLIDTQYRLPMRSKIRIK